MMKIYVTRRIPEKGLDMIREKFGEVDMNPDNRVLLHEELIENVKGADAVLCQLTDKIDADVMDSAGPSCKIFSNYAVGVNNIDFDAANERKIMIGNTPGVLTDATSTLAISLMFSVARRIVEADRFMRGENFEGWDPMLLLGNKVSGQTLGIIGAGRIGEDIAIKMHKGFGMNVLYTDLNGNEFLEDKTGAKKVDMDTLCKESDYISVNVNYYPETHHLINEERLSLMKENAIIVNTARGPVVDEEALVKALQQKWIFGAGLDVFENEPKMKPGLKDLDNVVIVPHIGSATFEARTKMSEMAAQNLIDALEGRLPEFLVNKEVFNVK
ncbi:D-glycerate dehydrogenase [Candidatus Peregrinibacteria bacterium]|nr:D-glycerate dehydrogenase [Candidatus Peregrinibacteria bacterium]